MIKSFKDAETRKIFEEAKSRQFGALARVAARKLRSLDYATCLDDLRNPPGNRLEALKGNRAGQYSIRVNDQYRICFRFEGEFALDVEIVDYH